MTKFGLVDAVPAVQTYIDRWNSRPSVAKVAAIDDDLLKTLNSSAA